MKDDLPKWTSNPLVVALIFGAACSIPILIGISDRAAQFAGGLSAAIAAVIAVIVGGNFNARNERQREERAERARINAVVRELRVVLEISRDHMKHFSDVMQGEVDAAQKASRTETTFLYSSVKVIVRRECAPLSGRLMEAVGVLPIEFAKATLTFVRQMQMMISVYDITLLTDKEYFKVGVPYLASTAGNLKTASDLADKALKASFEQLPDMN